MTKVIETSGRVAIYCPGCKEYHYMNVDPAKGRPCWTYNGDKDRPTFHPSILNRSGHHVPGQPQPPNCGICNYKDEDGGSWPWPCHICHSFVKDGMIQFLNDCTHELAGKTVPLLDIDEEKFK